MQKLFTEGTRGEHQKETEIGLVPESWEVVNLGKTVDIKTGKLNSNTAVENGIYPFFTCSQETFAINNYAFDQEAILLSGNNARAIYSVKHYKGKFNAYQRTYIFTILNETEYDYTFLKYVLTRQLEYLRTISIGSQTRYLTLGMLTTLRIQKPDIEEQRKIAKSIFVIENKIEILDKKKQTLESLFKTLLHELMTGQRRVHELEFEARESQTSL
jgi:type I restriction enzyme S subunit